MCTISRRGSGSHRVGFLGQNHPRPGPAQPAEGRRDRGKEGAETEAGRQGPGERRLAGRGRPGAAPAESPRVASRRPRRPGVAPRPRAREGSTHPACVVAAAGARVPGVRHAALCASALRLPPPRRGRLGPHHRSPRGTRFRPAGPAWLRFRPLAPSCAPPGLWCFMYSGPDESEVR